MFPIRPKLTVNLMWKFNLQEIFCQTRKQARYSIVSYVASFACNQHDFENNFPEEVTDKSMLYGITRTYLFKATKQKGKKDQNIDRNNSQKWK